MASEYLKWKYRDVRPEEKRELTAEEKRKNWWHYHKWHVAVAAVLLAIVADLVWAAATRVKPDYQIAYVGRHALPDSVAAALEEGFAALGEDLNGDGRVAAKLVQYVSTGDADAGFAASAEVKLVADLVECESYFFLLEDPEAFQRQHRSLLLLDGSLPEEGRDCSAGELSIPWDQCPALAEMELGEYTYRLLGETVTGSGGELASRLFLARRGFPGDKTCPYPEGCGALWEKLTEGGAA